MEMSDERDRSGLTRRTFLGAGAGGALTAALGWPLLEACTTTTAQPSSGSGAGVLPSYVPLKGVKPDYAGNAAGVRDLYTSFPANPFQSVSGTPGSGGDMAALVISFAQPPTPLAQNTYWQQMNRNLGVDYKPTIVASADWNVKLATVMAGGDLPDYMLLYPPGGVPNMLSFLEAKCMDLTELLSADNVKAYPNLANILTAAWRNTVYGGRIYGLPQPRGVFGNAMFIHSDYAQQVAGTWQPANTDDFLRLMKTLTQPARNVWGMCAPTQANYNLDFFMQVFRAPNHWKLENGKITTYLATDEARAAVAFARTCFQAGVFHPQANTVSQTQDKNWFYGGQIVAYQDGFSAYQQTWPAVKQVDSKFEPRVIVPFGHDGGRGLYWLGSGSFAFTAMKRTTKARAQELLRVADYLAAPFGSQEYLFLNFGVRDVDYRPNSDGAPVLTDTGKAEVALYQQYIAAANLTLYNAQYPDFIRTLHEQEQQLVPLGVADPSVGLYSETSTERSATLNTLLTDRLAAVINGRAPMSDYDQVLKDWRSQGGAQIEQELTKAYQSSHR
jgi:putative aldouronate transport system substrate-binding protein